MRWMLDRRCEVIHLSSPLCLDNIVAAVSSRYGVIYVGNSLRSVGKVISSEGGQTALRTRDVGWVWVVELQKNVGYELILSKDTMCCVILHWSLIQRLQVA